MVSNPLRWFPLRSPSPIPFGDRHCLQDIPRLHRMALLRTIPLGILQCFDKYQAVSWLALKRFRTEESAVKSISRTLSICAHSRVCLRISLEYWTLSRARHVACRSACFSWECIYTSFGMRAMPRSDLRSPLIGFPSLPWCILCAVLTSMFYFPDDLSNRMRSRVASAPTIPGPMGPLALPGGALPGASHAMMTNNLLPTGHPLPPRQSLPSPARSPRSQPSHSAAQTPVYTGPGGYPPTARMTPAPPTPRPLTAGPSYQQPSRPSMAPDGIPDPSILPPHIMSQSMSMEGLAGDAPADIVMQNRGPSQTPRPMSQAGSLSGAPTVREMSLARDSTHAHTPPQPPHSSCVPLTSLLCPLMPPQWHSFFKAICQFASHGTQRRPQCRSTWRA